MPKITITEKDLTSGGVYLANENVVYIPGLSTKTLKKEFVGVPTLCTSVEKFKEVFGDTPFHAPESSEEEGFIDKSFVMAHELLKLGMWVLYEVPSKTEGDNVLQVQTEAEINTALKASGFWTKLQDRGLYNIRFITSGAYGKDASDITAISRAMLDICGDVLPSRGDAIVLLDHAPTLTTKGDVESFFTGGTESKPGIGTSEKLKFGAGFTPWIHFQSADLADPLEMPATFAYLLAFAQSVQINPSWLAVAGASRGRIPGLVSPFVSIKYGEVEANALQTREQGKITINPICNINPFGYVVWGNRTLNPVGLGTTQQNDLVATNFLNIRNIVASIKKTLFVASRGLTFEQNSDVLWINFKSGITPLLDQMVSGNGIADYRLIKKKADKKATLKAIIRIVPIEAVEDFDLTIEMADSTESVTE